MTAYKQENAEKLRAVLTVQDGQIIWSSRTPDFYTGNFSRTYDAQGAADNWNATRAGKPPRWQYDTARGDFMAFAHLRQVSLKEVCAALGEHYPTQRVAVDKATKAYNRDKARRTAIQSIELKNGVPVWTVRTRKTHPKTNQILLDEFNRDFAGKPLRLHHKSGMYRIAFRLVTHEDLMQWLKEKDAK